MNTIIVITGIESSIVVPGAFTKGRDVRRIGIEDLLSPRVPV
jgi:hypothetical protein